MSTLLELIKEAKDIKSKLKAVDTLETLEEATKRANDLLLLFIQCKSNFPNVNFSISAQPPFCEIFIIGDKKVGSEYDMEMWKKVPILKIELNRYNFFPNNFFLTFSISFGTFGRCSRDWKLPHDKLVEKYMDALTRAVYDFTMTEENTF
jgi:hypothetical protein